MSGIIRIVVTAVAVLAAGYATAASILVSDFTAPETQPVGGTHINAFGQWSWLSYSATDSSSRTLGVNLSNTASDFLQQSDYPSSIDITGGTFLRITGSWTPLALGSDGDFVVQLGYPVATASFTYSQFANGPKTIDAPLSWNPSRPSNSFNIWELIGAGNASNTWGELQLTSMSVETVPEPSTYAMALAGIACGGYSMWRRRKRA